MAGYYGDPVGVIGGQMSVDEDQEIGYGGGDRERGCK